MGLCVCGLIQVRSAFPFPWHRFLFSHLCGFSLSFISDFAMATEVHLLQCLLEKLCSLYGRETADLVCSQPFPAPERLLSQNFTLVLFLLIIKVAAGCCCTCISGGFNMLSRLVFGSGSGGQSPRVFWLKCRLNGIHGCPCTRVPGP